MTMVEMTNITMRVAYNNGNQEQHSLKVYFNFIKS